MLDFMKTKIVKKKTHYELSPSFIVKKTNDLMTRGSSFYAIWDEANNIWSCDEYRAAEIIDKEIKDEYERLSDKYNDISVKYCSSFDSKVWEEFQRYLKNLPDNFMQLDETVTFKSQKINKIDFKSKKLTYDMSDGDISAYDELVSVLYSPEERQKFEWAIGSVLAGKSKDIQKFFVFYGSAGTGKSTIMNIIQMIFPNYYIQVDAKSLVSNGNMFATEQFKSNPLVAIQHDGDLSRIDDNSKLNSLVSHEEIVVNEKFKAQYTSRFNTLIFLGTNRPVQITDAKSGLMRRLIDIQPTGVTVDHKRYNQLLNRITFEISAIAKHCYDIFNELGEMYYDGYRSKPMIGATNDFYNFVMDNYEFFCDNEEVTLSECWKRYKLYCDDANVPYPYKKMVFKNELMNYFKQYSEHTKNASNVFKYFLKDKFDINIYDEKAKVEPWLKLDCSSSILDDIYKDCPAQYSTKNGIPAKRWSSVTTTLKDIDTNIEHYLKPPSNHVIFDFDYKDASGNKLKEKNIEEASKYPPTYAEFSKSGGGIHLHYIYDGDVNELANRINEDVEIKVFLGNSALRRRLTLCNDIPPAHIKDGLPKKKEVKKLIDFKGFESEKNLRNHILKCLRKEHHGSTKPEIDFIFKSLEDAYNSDLSYDLTTLRPKILQFAMSSTHQSDYCMKKVKEMKFASEDHALIKDNDKDKPIIFYDVEVFPNLFLVCWKTEGVNNVTRMINPESWQIEDLVNNYKLVGFNCRRYDNHILYARMLGCSNEEIYDLSQKIINGSKNSFFSQAYNLSYTDVYDYASKKQSLKKWEIELGIHHQELGLPWDKPVDKKLWATVAEYCDNDVIATEEVWNHTQADFKARQILATISGLTVNHSTNSHSTKIIFGDDKNPQGAFNYIELSTLFPGYTFENGKSIYRGEEIGEGGYVYAEPGMYEGYIPVKDVASMHPHSIIAMNLFGDKYTKIFEDLVQIRIHIKHGNFDKIRNMLDGKLSPFLKDESMAKDLSKALKIVINSIYGLTIARFDNPFKDPRNIDNIVAKRGALFMCELKHQVQERGFTVLHCKTDSIKILNPSDDILNFVDEFGKKYGYDFEIEDEYDKFCLVNDAVYIAHEKDGEWSATGKEFAHPYIFKSLFKPGSDIEFSDYCETRQVSKGEMYLDMNEGNEEEHNYKFIGKTGSFVPIKEGCGGGILYRYSDNKYYAVTGTKGYRWLESETVKDKFDIIDISYYDKLVDSAVEHIKKFGDIDNFINGNVDGSIVLDDFMNIPEGVNDKVPFQE